MAGTFNKEVVVSKVKKFLVVVAIVSTLGSSLACGGSTWCHPNRNTVQAFEQDKFECEAQAYSMSNNYGATGNPFIIIDFFKRCMRIKGWYECDN